MGGMYRSMQQTTSVLTGPTHESQQLKASDPLALQIGIQYGGGGEGRVISELFKFLPGAGFNVLGAVAEPENIAELTGGRFLSFASSSANKLYRFRSARRKLARILHEDRPEIVASHFALYALPVYEKLPSHQLITHFHGPWGAESAQDGAGFLASTARTLVEKSLYLRSARVIVLSEAFARLAAERYGVNPAKIRIVPGSVDIERFNVTATKAAARERLELPRDRPILLSVRRLVRRMGLSELILALRTVVTRVPDVLLCIAGRGLLRQELEQRVLELGLANHVRFLGFVDDDDLPYLYRAADINVVPTVALEGFGLVAAESLAAGVPAMVTKVGGLPEVVAGLAPELLFASPRADDLADGLSAALLGRLRLPDGPACSAYIRKNFNSQLMAERVAAVYREVL
jgi:glycosyltransferase involved in cell wall biosynthesis